MSLSKLNPLCKSILKLSDDDLDLAESEAREQSEYIHPLKGEKQAILNSFGDHNLKVIAEVRAFRKILMDFKHEFK